ncbi:hypothetical protein MCEMAEM6B_02225 [Mycobacteriaceae bacterium]
MTAVVAIGDLGHRFPGHGRGVVGGIAHPGRGELRTPRLEHGPQLRCGEQFPHTHPVGALAATPGEAAFAGPVLIGEHPVGVDGDSQPIGEHLQLIGTQHRGLLGQQGLAALGHPHCDVVGQLPQELLNRAQMLRIQYPGRPGGRGGRQRRRQRLPRQTPARRQLFGIALPTAGLAAADPQHIGHHHRHRRPQLRRIQTMDHRVRDSALTTSAGLQPIQQTHPLTIGHLSPISATQHLEHPLEGIHRLRNRTHVRNNNPDHRHGPALVYRLWMGV